MAGTRHRCEHRPEHNRGAAGARAADGGRRDVDTERQDSASGQRQDVSAGTTADVEHGTERAIEHPRVCGAQRTEPLLEWKVPTGPVLGAHVEGTVSERRPVQLRGRVRHAATRSSGTPASARANAVFGTEAATAIASV